MPGGRPTKYKPEYPEQAKKLCLLGATDKDLANFFDITEDTITQWKKDYPEFSLSLKAGKDAKDAEVEKRLFERATGYTHKVRKPMSVSDPAGQGSHIEIIEYEETIAPDTTSMIFWLKNRQSAKWRDKQELEHSGEIGVTIMDDVK